MEIDGPLKSNKEKLLRIKPIKGRSNSSNSGGEEHKETHNKESNKQEGSLFIKLEGKSESTSLFELKKPTSSSNSDGSKSFKRMEAFIGNVKLN
jgi:hypothetical protein